MLKVPFGLYKKQLIEPSTAKKNGLTSVICPGCGRLLTAKGGEGTKVISHFAHKPNEECSTGRETAIHLAAKEVVSQFQYLPVPIHLSYLTEESTITGLTLRTNVHAEGISNHIYRSVQEYRISTGHIVDVWLEGDKIDIAVEILVTHAVDAQKLESFSSLNIYCLEINLSKVSRQKAISFDSIRGYIRNNWHEITEWLSRPDLVSARRNARDRMKYLHSLQSGKLVEGVVNGKPTPATKHLLDRIHASKDLARLKKLKVEVESWVQKGEDDAKFKTRVSRLKALGLHPDNVVKTCFPNPEEYWTFFARFDGTPLALISYILELVLDREVNSARYIYYEIRDNFSEMPIKKAKSISPAARSQIEYPHRAVDLVCKKMLDQEFLDVKAIGGINFYMSIVRDEKSIQEIRIKQSSKSDTAKKYKAMRGG